MNGPVKIAALVVAAVCFVMSTACEVIEETDGRSLARASIRVNVAEETGGVIESAEVSVSSVSLTPAGAGEPSIDLVARGGGSSSVSLSRLRGRAEAVIAEAEIAPGSYESLSVDIDAVTVTLAPGFSFGDGSRKRRIEPVQGARPLDVPLSGRVRAREGVLTTMVLDFVSEDTFRYELDAAEPGLVRAIRFEPVVTETRRHEAPSG